MGKWGKPNPETLPHPTPLIGGGKWGGVEGCKEAEVGKRLDRTSKQVGRKPRPMDGREFRKPATNLNAILRFFSPAGPGIFGQAIAPVDKGALILYQSVSIPNHLEHRGNIAKYRLLGYIRVTNG